MSAAVYEWTPGTGQLRRLYATDAALADCQPRRPDELICLRETSLRPRYLVAIDLTRGRVREVADPNPEFAGRSEEHTSELQSLMRISYAVFCLKKKKNINK